MRNPVCHSLLCNLQEEMKACVAELNTSLEQSNTERIEHIAATFTAEKAHALRVLESELSLQYAEAKVALEEEFNVTLFQVKEDHKAIIADMDSKSVDSALYSPNCATLKFSSNFTCLRIALVLYIAVSTKTMQMLGMSSEQQKDGEYWYHLCIMMSSLL